MASNDQNRDRSDERLGSVLVEYLEAVESGIEPDRRAWLVRYPEFYDELSDFFADRDIIEAIAGPLREAVRDPEEDLILGQLDPSEIPDHLGRIGPYEILDWIGRGGMGIVFKGFDSSLNRFVAIKILAPQWAADPGARRRFTREARSAAAISHPHVVTIHAVGEWKGRPYLVMEYIPGSTLEERLEEGGPPPLAEILTIAIQVASGLAAAHAQGLIHRDVKPANILLEGNLTRVRLVDFGLARARDDAQLTQQGTLAGTPRYMAPEQARGETLDSRSDLFSLGGVIHALCTGEPPFRGNSIPEVLRRVCDESPPSPRRINPEVPEWLVAIIGRLLAKRPDQRFDTATEVAERLERHLARLRDPSLPPVASVESVEDRVADRRLTRRFAVIVPLGAGLIAGLGVAAWEWVARPDRATSRPRDRRPVAIDTALPDRPAPDRPALTAYPDPDRLTAIYRRDFRDSRPILPGLTLATRPGLEAVPEPGPGGVRLTIPRGLVDGIGLATTFRISGDFEITAGFDVPPTEPPRIGTGIGPELRITTTDPDVFGSIARLERDKGAVFALAHATVDPDGRRRILGRWPPAASRSGRFRLIRRGSMLHYLVSDGVEASFDERFRVEFGTEPIESITLGIDSGGSPEGADVVWNELSIRAERFTDRPLESR